LAGIVLTVVIITALVVAGIAYKLLHKTQEEIV
jgi:hypothetical protein